MQKKYRYRNQCDDNGAEDFVCSNFSKYASTIILIMFSNPSWNLPTAHLEIVPYQIHLKKGHMLSTGIKLENIFFFFHTKQVIMGFSIHSGTPSGVQETLSWTEPAETQETLSRMEPAGVRDSCKHSLPNHNNIQRSAAAHPQWLECGRGVFLHFLKLHQ